MTRFIFLLFALILNVSAQYYANPQRSYMMGSPYGSYSNTRYYGPQSYYQQSYQQQQYRPYYNYYPQQQQQQYSSHHNYPYNYYQQPYQYSSNSYPRAAAYSAPTMSLEAGPPNALVSAHLFCMNCGRGRQ